MHQRQLKSFKAFDLSLQSLIKEQLRARNYIDVQINCYRPLYSTEVSLYANILMQLKLLTNPQLLLEMLFHNIPHF